MMSSWNDNADWGCRGGEAPCNSFTYLFTPHGHSSTLGPSRISLLSPLSLSFSGFSLSFSGFSLSFPLLCHSRGGGNPVLNSYATHNFTLTNPKRLQKRGRYNRQLAARFSRIYQHNFVFHVSSD
jgi:hypothetical protein